MQTKLIFWLILASLVTILIYGCSNRKVELDVDVIEPKNTVQAILVSGQRKWESGKPLTLFLAISNNTSNNICFDGRMTFPGNIDVMIKLPNSKVIRASKIAVELTTPQKGDLVELMPRRLYGSILTIKPTSGGFWSKELLQLEPGVYSVWIKYDMRSKNVHIACLCCEC